MADLIFPKSFSEAESNAAAVHLSGLDNIDAQLILDEVAGRLSIQTSKLHNPVGYLRSLILIYRRDEFIPETALAVQKDRAYRKQVADAVRYSDEVAEQKTLKKLGLK